MKKIFATSLVVVASVIASSQTVFARDFGDIYAQCGLGAKIAPTNTVVAVITNITFDLGTTAIISNASSPETCTGGKAKTAMFINESYDAIASDLTRGNGKYLDSLVALNGWNSSNVPAIKEDLRNNFGKLVATEGYSKMTQYQKAEAFFNLVSKYPSANV